MKDYIPGENEMLQIGVENNTILTAKLHSIPTVRHAAQIAIDWAESLIPFRFIFMFLPCRVAMLEHALLCCSSCRSQPSILPSSLHVMGKR